MMTSISSHVPARITGVAFKTSSTVRSVMNAGRSV
jgi:hypothetical protein